MRTQRKTYSAEFKGKVAVEANRGSSTINELATEYGVHPNQQEEVYIIDYQRIGDAVSGLGDYFDFYNHTRLHQSLS